MCILFLYFCDNPDPDGYRLIIASNRDEFYSRPTDDAKFWESNPNVIAGKTLPMHTVCIHGLSASPCIDVINVFFINMSPVVCLPKQFLYF